MIIKKELEMKKLIFTAVMIFLSLSLFAKEQINVYTYHNHAPFIINEKLGLTHELIKKLNQNDEFDFKLKVIPRSRLNYILKPWISKKCETKRCANNWIVLWVNHKWGFGKDSLENFSWTPLLNDSNAIISSNTKKFEYTKPEDLIGKGLAGIAGHKYVGIDDLVKAGKIKRINGSNEVDNLKVVLANRVDVTLLPKSAFDYYQKTNSEFSNLYVSKVPHQSYMRNIMTNRQNKLLVKYLNSLKLGE